MSQYEQIRIKVKQDKHLLLNAKRNARSPERLMTLDPTSPGGFFSVSSKTIPDRIKLVGNKLSTGRFITGKSVPKSRPTVFWEEQEKEIPFNFEEFMADREQRTQRHKEKIKMLKQHYEEEEQEVADLEDQIRLAEIQIK